MYMWYFSLFLETPAVLADLHTFVEFVVRVVDI